MARMAARFPGLAGVAVLLLAGAVGAEESEFTLRTHGGPVRLAPVMPARGQAVPRPASGLPKLACPTPLFFEVKLGPEQVPHLFVLDSSTGAEPGYDRLYVDTNGDGRLSDEQAFEGKCSLNRGYTVGFFHGCKLQVKYQDGAQPWAFNAQYVVFQDANSRAQPSLMLTAAASCEGMVDFGGKKLKVALVDGDSNGRFNDLFAFAKAPAGTSVAAGVGPPSGDWILVDANADGQFDAEALGLEAFGCGRYLIVDGKCYEISVSASGRRVSAARSSAPLGMLRRVGDGPFAVALLTPGSGMLALYSSGEPVAVPAGLYRLYTCVTAVTDEAGTLWRATGRANAPAQAFRVEEGKLAAVRFGAPLKVGATAAVYPSGSASALKAGDTVRLSLAIKGEGGEEYSAGAITKAGGRLPPPTVAILARGGQEVASGTFQYG